MKDHPAGRKIILIFLICIFAIYFFVMSTLDLVNTKSKKDVKIAEAYSVLSVENSIHGIIPTGHDYYYIGAADDGSVYLIKAGKNWLDKNFNSDGTAKSSGGLSIQALQKRTAFKVEQEVISIGSAQGLDLSQVVYAGTLYVNYKFESLLKIIAGLLLVFMVIIDVFINKKYGDNWPKNVILIFVFSLVAVLIFSMSTI